MQSPAYRTWDKSPTTLRLLIRVCKKDLLSLLDSVFLGVSDGETFSSHSRDPWRTLLNGRVSFIQPQDPQPTKVVLIRKFLPEPVIKPVASGFKAQ